MKNLSLEECEKLCSTLSILKNSTLEFCGTFESLRKKYGRGLCLMVKCERQSEPSNDVEILENFLLKKIPNSSIKGYIESYHFLILILMLNFKRKTS